MATHRLTRLGLADPDDVLAGRLGTEVMVVAHYTMHLGTGEVQFLRELSNCCLADPAESDDKLMQDLHEHLCSRAEVLDNLRRNLFIECLGCHSESVVRPRIY